MSIFGRGETDEQREYRYRVMRLAEYNGRVSQGIVHTPEYVEYMKREQAWHDYPDTPNPYHPNWPRRASVFR